MASNGPRIAAYRILLWGICGLLGLVVLAVCVLGVYRLREASGIAWKRMQTLDRFGVLRVEFEGGLFELARTPQGSLDHALNMYAKRLGSAPLDGWGSPIQSKVTVGNGVCELHLASPGKDMISGTADDITQVMTYSLRSTGSQPMGP